MEEIGDCCISLQVFLIAVGLCANMTELLNNTIRSGKRVNKMHFVQKLWFALNKTNIDCLYWNEDKTAVVIDLDKFDASKLAEILRCNTAEDFLCMLKHYGFVRQPLGKSDSSHAIYRHPVFEGSNEQLIDCWMKETYNQLDADYSASACSCLRPNSLANEFRPRDIDDKFEKVKANISREMKLLNAYIQQEYVKNGANGVDTLIIPLKYYDDATQANAVTTSKETLGVDGYHGKNDSSELQTYFGNVLVEEQDDVKEEFYLIERQDLDENLPDLADPVTTTVKSEPMDTTVENYLCIDEATPNMITDSVLSCIEQLDYE
ncbi:uncharacterized protein LOC131262579 [Anopheles coustani]|uniref:uncharacterized protein LOC131262579 n=1 Tax=Anopheles coustani TaxID=139045 RepID=UPI0026591AEF|nr:uncharacterized protein LOC131262579 [Anopheles coustani]